MIAAAWAWALVGIAAFLLVGLLAAVAFGLLGVPGDFLRRASQSAARPRESGGVELPEETPERTPQEVAEEADRERKR